MKTYYLTRDSNGKLHICSHDENALAWEKARGREVIGKIETDKSILEINKFVCGV